MAKDSKQLVKSEPTLPSVAPEVSQDLLERANEVRDNIASVENFRLPKIRMASTGLEVVEGEDPVKELEVVIIHAKKTNIYYENPYDPSDVSAPDCFSTDGEVPHSSVKVPQNASCRKCSKAEFGTNARGTGKACRNLKPIYVLCSDESIMPRVISVPPSSLKEANRYLMDITERGLSYRKIKTKISVYKENPKDTYVKLKFSVAGKLDPQRIVDVEYLRNKWLPLINDHVVDRDGQDEATSETKAQAQPMPNPSVEVAPY